MTHDCSHSGSDFVSGSHSDTHNDTAHHAAPARKPVAVPAEAVADDDLLFMTLMRRNCHGAWDR